jgi:hypothetical protein
MINADSIRKRWATVGSTLDEQGRRLFAAIEVRTAGWGVSKDHGLAAELPGAHGAIAQDGQNRIHTPALGVNDISGLSKLAAGRKLAHESVILGEYSKSRFALFNT